MSIWITGDIHGDPRRFGSKSFTEGKKFTKKDYIIILGDFGLVWDVNESKKNEQYWQAWLRDKPWTTLFIDGNHENFDRLKTLPQIDMFGSSVGVVMDSIYHLKRGEVYIINGKKFFTFGGGISIDKHLRSEYVSWWKEEMPSFDEYQNGMDNLNLHGRKVDYVLTHTCPSSLFSDLIVKMHTVIKGTNQLTRYLNIIKNEVLFKEWHMGHFHVVHDVGKFHFHYGDIIKLEK